VSIFSRTSISVRRRLLLDAAAMAFHLAEETADRRDNLHIGSPVRMVRPRTIPVSYRRIGPTIRWGEPGESRGCCRRQCADAAQFDHRVHVAITRFGAFRIRKSHLPLTLPANVSSEATVLPEQP